MPTSLLTRIDDLEWDLRRLEGELQDLRREARATGAADADAAPRLFAGHAAPASPAGATPPVSARPAPQVPPAAPAARPRAAARSTSPRQARPPLHPRPAPRPRTRPSIDVGAFLARLDLVGAGGLAVVGGAVMALGIGLLFVLAAERGWIGPETRIVIGAVVSATLVGTGFVIRARYGQLTAALAAVGAGVAGAYATLAAAAALYDLVPDAVALPLAAVIAGVGVAISVAWRSETIAALGLVGAALAPALQAVDAGIAPDGVAFAVLVLAATAVVAVIQRWEVLLWSVLVVVGVQAGWLVEVSRFEVEPGVVAVSAAFAAVALASACAWQVVSGNRVLTPLAGTVSLAVVGFTLLSVGALLDAGSDRGVALAIAAGAFGLAWLVLRMLQPDLALVLAGGALGLGAVALAGLLSADGLTLAWAAEAALFSCLAYRLRDARMQFAGLVYLALATGHLLAVTAPTDRLFDRAHADASAAMPAIAVALAALAAGLLAPRSYRITGETGPLAFVTGIGRALDAHRVGIAETLVGSSVVLGVLAAGLVLVDLDFDAGHVALTGLAAGVAAAATAITALRRSTALAAAAVIASFAVVAKALAFDAFELEPERGPGGVSLLLAAAGLLAAGVALQVLWRMAAKLVIVAGSAATVALGVALIGVAGVVPADPTTDGDLSWAWYGVGVALVAGVYLGLAAAALRAAHLRDLSTCLWLLGLAAVLVSELALLRDDVWYPVAVAVTAVALVSLARPARETRLWLVGAALLATDGLVVLLAVTPPAHLLTVNASPAAGVLALVAVAFAGVAVALTAPSHRRWIVGAVGVLDLYILTLVTLELAVRISGAALETDFERGHTVVSAIWALTGLSLLVAGVVRRSAVLRYAGLALFGVTLAKIFLYDLAELSSVARAASFLAVGGLLLAGGFLVQRFSDERPAQG